MGGQYCRRQIDRDYNIVLYYSIGVVNIIEDKMK